MVYYAGIDLGKRMSHITVITPERKVVEDLKIENSPEAFGRIFRKYKGDIVAGCEASGNAFWAADTLSPLVQRILVGHTTKIRWIAEARNKTDRIDAGILAELVRADLFPTIAIPPKRVRELRELVRGLIRIRRQAARLRNQVHSLLGRHGVAYKRAEVKGTKLSELVKETELVVPARIAAEALLRAEKALRTLSGDRRVYSSQPPDFLPSPRHEFRLCQPISTAASFASWNQRANSSRGM